MSENTTRIVDLPDTTSMPQHTAQFGSGPMPPMTNTRTDYDPQNPTYKPINVHPNPYGNMLQPDVMPHPEAKQYQMDPNQMPPPEIMEQMLKNLKEDQYAELKNMPPVQLPSRDIPRDQSQFFHDEEIKANYVPKPKKTRDYVKEYEEASEKSAKKQESAKKKAEKIDDAMTEFQLPLIIMFLFFIYQIPFINNMMYKYLSILPIFHTDGNLNFYGILLKSIMFGFSFWSLQKLVILIA